MALSNAQYDEIMRAYDKRQLQNKFIHEKRIQAAYKAVPRLKEIDDSIASVSVKQAAKLIDGDTLALADLKAVIADYKEERAALLEATHYPIDYFEPVYTCPDCRDTGSLLSLPL